MRKLFPYSLVIISLAVAGYYIYNQWFSRQERTLWELVPNNSMVVYESQQVAIIWNDLIQTNQWENFKTIAGLAKLEADMEWLDSLTGGQGGLDQISRNESMLISINQISNTETDATFFVSLRDESAQRLLGKALDSLSANGEFKLTQRTYQETQLREIRSSNNSAIFTYFIIDNILVGSFTPFLIEDVVRNISSDDNFENRNEALFGIPSLKNDKGNLYLNYDAVFGYLKYYFNQENNFVETIDGLLVNGFLDLSFDDRNFMANGFTFAADNSFAGTLINAKPVESKVDRLVPSKTAILLQLNVGSGEDWRGPLEMYWNKQPSLAGNWSFLQTEYGFQNDRFFSWMSGEIALCILESIRGRPQDKILFIQSSDINESLNQLNTLTERANNIIGDTLYQENFSNHTITQLKVNNFPEKILGTQFNGFSEVFFMPLEDYIVFSNRIENLKSLILDIESENTWGKRVSHTSFLENTLENFNLSLIIEVPSAFDVLNTQGSAQLQSFLNENSRVLKKIAKASFQFRNQGDMLYTSITVQSSNISNERSGIDFENVMNVSFARDIISKPHIVRNHLNGSLEILVQDSSYMLHLINNQGEVLWNDSLGVEILGEIEQIDYYKNNKLQYLVCLRDKFKLIDRNGAEIGDFQLELPFTVFNWSLIDYDRSKNYRILVSDLQGNLYLYDMRGQNLEGWMPRSGTGRLGSIPFHLRVRSRDVLVAVEENGIINLSNRRGENISGFPLNVDARTNNALFIEAGGDFESTILTVLTNDGELIRFNLTGEILDRNQLFKPSPATTFTLVEERAGRNFIILQQDGSRLSVLDSNGTLLFEKDYLSSAPLLGQFYDFGSGKKLFIVTDPIQEFTYIYQEDGELVNSRPLESGKQVGILYFESLQKFHVYSAYMNNFEISGFYTR